MNVTAKDPQFQMASKLADDIELQLNSAFRETFTILIYPHADRLMTADVEMRFSGNSYNGEEQIRQTLKQRQKFTDETSDPTFRGKCEERLFTTNPMLWAEIKRRAALNTRWQWHHPSALDSLKGEMISKGFWVEEGSYVNKQPPIPKTAVRVQQLERDEVTGEVTLRLTAVHGNIVYYDEESTATLSSEIVIDLRKFPTAALKVSFLCVDSTNQHVTGDPTLWQNEIVLKQRQFHGGANGNEKKLELRAYPNASIRYTTNGADPRQFGLPYTDVFTVPSETVLVQAVAEKDGVTSRTLTIPISWDKRKVFRLDEARPATWLHPHRITTTKETYEFLERIKKHDARLAGPRLAVNGSTGWVEFTSDSRVTFDYAEFDPIITQMRGLLLGGEVEMDVSALTFRSGQHLLDWVEDTKMELEPDEVKQDGS